MLQYPMSPFLLPFVTIFTTFSDLNTAESLLNTVQEQDPHPEQLFNSTLVTSLAVCPQMLTLTFITSH